MAIIHKYFQVYPLWHSPSYFQEGGQSVMDHVLLQRWSLSWSQPRVPGKGQICSDPTQGSSPRASSQREALLRVESK